MKKTYDAPAVVTTGSIVRETKFSTDGDTENAGHKIVAGSIGYNL